MKNAPNTTAIIRSSSPLLIKGVSIDYGYSPHERMNTQQTTGDFHETGPACKSCGSRNTTRDSVLRKKPSVLAVIFFGWVFLLIRGAFAMRTSTCLDCGERHRYKSVGSWIALSLVLGFVVLIAAAIILD